MNPLVEKFRLLVCAGCGRGFDMRECIYSAAPLREYPDQTQAYFHKACCPARLSPKTKGHTK